MNLKRFVSLKSTLMAIIAVFSLFTVTNLNAAKVEAKELTGVVTGIEHIKDDDTILQTDAEGVYQLITGRSSRLRLTFDLTNYKGNLQDGDYFTFELPAPMTLSSDVPIQLEHLKTKVKIATATFASKGSGQGGTVTVTLQNLQEYLEITKGDLVDTISGDFAISYRFDSDQVKTRINYESSSLKQTESHLYSTTTITAGGVNGYENFAKNGGMANKGHWESPALAAIGAESSGEFYSYWRVRVNTGGQDYGSNLVLTDSLPTDPAYATIRYIPESVEVWHNPNMANAATGPSGTKLVEGVDYSLQWNATYTHFTITFKDGAKKYFVVYKTTTPNDGSMVANTVSLTKSDGTVLTQRSNNNRTSMTATARSQFSGTITASTAYKIKINKVDEETLLPVAGAVYTVTAVDGSVPVQEVTTNDKGLAVTRQYAETMLGKQFIIKEKTPPTGYYLDTTEYTVTLGVNNSAIAVKDKPIPATVTITAEKQLTGRSLVDSEFAFKLYNSKGMEVAEARNDINGLITFANVEVTEKAVGSYNYTIREVDTQLTGVTYDTTPKTVTVQVTRSGGVLTAAVTSAPVTITNVYIAPTTTTTTTTTETTVATTESTTTVTTSEPTTTSTTTEGTTTATSSEPTTTATTTESTTTATTSEPTTTATTTESTTTVTTSEPTTTATTTTEEPTTSESTSEVTTTEAVTTESTTSVEGVGSTASTTVDPATTTTDGGGVPPVTLGVNPTGSKKVLPKTGESSTVWNVVAGLVILLFAGIGYYYHKEKA
ncbi:Spy0128 family protein [Streptococcus oriscaviae]|uniref:Spy0128 family protein n=1 Tax=Streptococcus oriscaviae TaxID=2781599 RepID=UPI0020129577|nr:FctA domain-containing protein [Streptococcus oriscaviae]